MSQHYLGWIGEDLISPIFTSLRQECVFKMIPEISIPIWKHWRCSHNYCNNYTQQPQDESSTVFTKGGHCHHVTENIVAIKISRLL